MLNGVTPVPASETSRRGARPRAVALVALVVGVISAALLIIVFSYLRGPIRGRDAVTAIALTVGAIGYDMSVRRIEYIRRLKSSGPYITMTSVWTFSASVTLPLRWSVLVALLVVGSNELQGRLRGVHRPIYRIAFNTAAVIISCAVASSIIGAQSILETSVPDISGVRALIILSAIVAYGVTDSAIIGSAIALSNMTVKPEKVLGTINENVLEFATLTLGAMVALAVKVDVWLSLLAMPAMLLLQRSALVEQLESDANEDGKTGLLNAIAWEHLAGRDLAGSIARKQPVSLLAIDLDNFKRVNDNYGHLSGDEVLKAVATCMKTMLRDRDLISRFGGEEFMALLPGADSKEAMIVAERLRTRVENLRVAQVGTAHQAAVVDEERVDGKQPTRSTEMRITVSVGVASYPSHGQALAELMEKADAALYQAKGDGRNRVQLSPKLVETEVEQLQMPANETDPDPVR